MGHSVNVAILGVKKALKWMLFLSLFAIVGTHFVMNASDHDDGESEFKERNLNITDVYVFREDTEIAGGSSQHLVFIMNSNPRSLPRQQYYFSDQARYEINIGQVGTDNQANARTLADLKLRFEFSQPDLNAKQYMTITAVKNGVERVVQSSINGEALVTTTLADTSDISNSINVDGYQLDIFAGLRQDPFYFDVNNFFEARAAAANAFLSGDTDNVLNAFLGEYTAGDPVNFTADYNVNSIVVRVPFGWLKTNGESVFDVWTTISVPKAL